MADARRCGQTDLDQLALSRNAKEVASADGECEGADKQASAPTSCSLYFVGDLQRNARGSHRSRISHPGARSLLRRPRARTVLPSEARQRENQQATTNGPDPLALACAPATLAPDRSRGEALCRVQRQAGDLSQMQKGADPWQVAGYLGMSLKVLLNTYGHHHPDCLSDAVEKIAMREPASDRKAHISGAVSGAVIPLRRNNT